MKTEIWRLDKLRYHPKSIDIFRGLDPQVVNEYRKFLLPKFPSDILIKEDGTILTGYMAIRSLREVAKEGPSSWDRACRAVLSVLKTKKIQVQVSEPLSEAEELDIVVMTNIHRFFTPAQCCMVFNYAKKRDQEAPSPKKRVTKVAAALHTTVERLKHQNEALNHPALKGKVQKLIDDKTYTFSQVASALSRARADLLREGREPTSSDLLLYLWNPVETPKSLLDLVVEVSLDAPKPPESKAATEPVVLERNYLPPRETRRSKQQRLDRKQTPVETRFSMARAVVCELLEEVNPKDNSVREIQLLHNRLTGFLSSLGRVTYPEPLQEAPYQIEDWVSLFNKLAIKAVSKDPVALKEFLCDLSKVTEKLANTIGP